MTAVQKFMFDHAFDNGSPTPAELEADSGSEQTDDLGSGETHDEEEVVEEEVQPGFSEQQMEAAKTEAFEAGRKEGIEGASKTVEHDTLVAIRAVAQHLTDLFSAQEQANSALIKDGVGIAATITRKLFPALDEAARLDEISRLVEQTLLRLIEEPRVVARINPALMDTLGRRLDGLKAGAGYEGRIILKEDTALGLGDCRLEWGDGSAERNTAALWKSIDGIIEGTAGIVERIVPDEVVVDVSSERFETTDDATTTDADTEQDAASIDDQEPSVTPEEEPTPESEVEKRQEDADPAEGPETTGAIEPQNTADSGESVEEDMIAGNEADIVEPEQTQELASEHPERDLAPSSDPEEELEIADKEAVTEELTPEEAAPEEAAPEEAAPEEAAPEEAAPEEAAPEEAAPEEAAPEEAAPEEAAPEEAAPEEAAPEEDFVDEVSSDDARPDETASEEEAKPEESDT